MITEKNRKIDISDEQIISDKKIDSSIKFASQLDSYTLPDLRKHFEDLGEKPFRANQLFQWIHRHHTYDLDQMKNLSQKLKESLSSCNIFTDFKVHSIDQDPTGTTNFLFELHDGNIIESVLIVEPDRYTACISSQVGCRMGCKFCVTAELNLIRNLTTAEIVRQAEFIYQYTADKFDSKLSNIVFMGMGEPLDNFDGVVSAISILTDPQGMGFGRRKITVSTCGVADKIEKLLNIENAPNLAISINAPYDELRNKIMPVNNRFNLDEVTKTIRNLPIEKKRDNITIGYVLFKDLNDSVEDAKLLDKRLKGLPIKINLIRFNEGRDGFQRPDEENVLEFQKYLMSKGYNVFIRKSSGRDINAACGQLAGKARQ